MKRKIFLLFVVIAAFLASRWLFKPGYFLMHDDLQMMRQLEMEKCFQDRQIPCRWVPDMAFGYGYPLFNFYPPLPFYIGQIFRWLGFSFVTTAKLGFALQFFLSGVAMFVLGADLWGPWGGLISAVFYIWAPYHSVDVYVRGAMNEAWSFIWFPLIFWAAKKLIEQGRFKYLVWLALSWAGLLLSHSLMTMIFAPAFLVWSVFWLIEKKRLSWGSRGFYWKLALAGFWALGLAAFFVLPVLFERNLTHIETMFSGYFDWRAHFVSLNQLFISRFWGWGPSLWGQEDGMSFSLGHVHWVLGVVIVAFVSFRFFQSRKKKISSLILILGLFFSAMTYAFLTHQKSVFIWKMLPPLEMAQFPWRLLAGATFFFSLLAGAAGLVFKKRWLNLLLLVLVIAWNWSFFRPEKMGPLTDEEKFSGRAWEYQQTAGIYDYLPKTAFRAPTSAAEGDWVILEGEVKDVKAEKGTNWFRWEGEVVEPTTLQLNILFFPGWKGWDNYQEIPLSYDQELGRIEVSLDPGPHQLYFRFTNTPIRSWANLFSLLSWGLLVLVVFRKKWLRLV